MTLLGNIVLAARIGRAFSLGDNVYAQLSERLFHSHPSLALDIRLIYYCFSKF